jgi:hypothetical protein
MVKAEEEREGSVQAGRMAATAWKRAESKRAWEILVA